MLKIIKPTSNSGQALLLLHGWGFDHQIWSSFLPQLNTIYQVYQIDLPGFGETPCMPWDIFQSKLCQQLPDEVILCGWSMGGLIATRLALEHPERFSHLINMASSPCFVATNHWPGITLKQLDFFYQQLQSNPEHMLTDFVRLQQPKVFQDKLQLPKQMNLEGLKNGLDILKNWNFNDKLHQLKCPTAYLLGRLDRIVPASTMTALQTHYPKFQSQLISKAGHMPFLSHPDICLDFIIEHTKDY